MTKPYVSIIVPIYNVENYLEQNLSSLIKQTLENIEIIAVNDGSTDQSLDILTQFQRQYPHKLKVFSQKNSGLSAARNKGIQEATGEFIGFIDSDDFVEENMFEKMVKLVNNETDIVVCDIEYYWEHEEKRNFIMKGLDPKYKFLDRDKQSLLSPLFAWNKIYRRQFLLEQNIQFEKGTWYEDLEVVTYLLVKAKKIAYLEEVMIHYRQRHNSIMATRSPRCKEIFNVLSKIYARFKEHDLLSRYTLEVEYLFIENLLLYGQYRFLMLDDYEEVYKKSMAIIKSYFPCYKKNPYIKYLGLKNKVFLATNNSFTNKFYRKYLIRK